MRARAVVGTGARAATDAWRGSGCVSWRARAGVVPGGRAGGFSLIHGPEAERLALFLGRRGEGAGGEASGLSATREDLK